VPGSALPRRDAPPGDTGTGDGAWLCPRRAFRPDA